MKRIYVATAEALERITKQVAKIATFYPGCIAFVELTKEGRVWINIEEDEFGKGATPDVYLSLEVNMVAIRLNNASKILDHLYLNRFNTSKMPWGIKTVEAVDAVEPGSPIQWMPNQLANDGPMGDGLTDPDEQTNLDNSGL